MSRTGLLPALLLSLTLAMAGCGGDTEGDNEGDAQPEAISKADFTAQAEEICADGNAEISAGADALGEDPAQEQIEQFAADVIVPNLQAQHDDLAELGAPEGDEAEVESILDSLQEGIDAVEADPSLITSSDDPFAEASDLAAEYGLAACAE